MKPLSKKSPKLVAKITSCASSQLSHWKTRIENSDANALWRELHRMVSAHPLVRSALGMQQGAAALTPHLSLHDLTQDLYVLLLQKNRFEHYLTAQMTDTEIEREIFQIELTNLLIGNLRRRRPENYRIVRRVSQALESDQRFRRFRRNKSQNQEQVERYRQAADAVFGLREWNDSKPMKDNGTFSDLIVNIPMRRRNRRRAGCTGEAQVIVSNQELVELMVEIFEAIDSPAPLRVLRQLALSKLPVYDPNLTSIEDEINEERHGRNYYDSLASSDASPEEATLRSEQETEARLAANRFLDKLGLLTRSNPQRTERLWRVLWHCYFDVEEPSQLEIAERVGISDSSVSDYRRKIEVEMRNLKFSPEQLSSFAEELNEQLRWRLSLPERAQRQIEPAEEFNGKIIWPSYEYGSAAAAVIH
ncbi:MAG TPA: hypothetical protein PLD20_18030 [Blastocatellia bacterium]|nr:hypothetical protein [Blastocatellia bacterium]HMX26155.1 hypothetical protein [Blastocatellia bacterium]HMY73272.1 hypothetical protein [Blastocatellia bacterium]HMZ19840.1 hypothetical protein [Blastocatellia bacterium]